MLLLQDRTTLPIRDRLPFLLQNYKQVPLPLEPDTSPHVLSRCLPALLLSVQPDPPMPAKHEKRPVDLNFSKRPS